MKRILSLILVVVVLIGMIACSKDAAESEDKENSNLNDMNNKNDIVYTDNEVLFYCQDRCDNDDDSTYLYCYNYKGELMSNDIAKAVGFLAPNGLAVAMDPQTEKYGFVDEKGVFVIEPIFENVSGFSSNGLAMAVFDGKYGFINSKAEIVIPFEHFVAFPFSDTGFAKVGGENARYGLIDEKNNLIIDCKYADVIQCSDYVVCIEITGNEDMSIVKQIVDVYNYSGEVINSFTSEFTNETYTLYATTEYSKIGNQVESEGNGFYYQCVKNQLFRYVMGANSLEILEVYDNGEFKKYSELYNITSKHVATMESGVAYGIETNNEILIPFEYNNIYCDSGYYVCIKYVNESMNASAIDIYDENFVKTAENLEYNYLPCLDYKANQLGTFLPEGYFCVYEEGYEGKIYGVIDYNGSVIVEPVFYSGIGVNEYAGKSDWKFNKFENGDYETISEDMKKALEKKEICKVNHEELRSAFVHNLYEHLEDDNLNGHAKMKITGDGELEISECAGVKKEVLMKMFEEYKSGHPNYFKETECELKIEFSDSEKEYLDIDFEISCVSESENHKLPWYYYD